MYVWVCRDVPALGQLGHQVPRAISGKHACTLSSELWSLLTPGRSIIYACHGILEHRSVESGS